MTIGLNIVIGSWVFFTGVRWGQGETPPVEELSVLETDLELAPNDNHHTMGFAPERTP